MEIEAESAEKREADEEHAERLRPCFSCSSVCAATAARKFVYYLVECTKLRYYPLPRPRRRMSFNQLTIFDSLLRGLK